MRNPELQRIQRDLARAKQRVAEIESGQRGVRPPADWRQDTDGSNTAHGLAYTAQLQAQRDTVTRLELEYVQAMIPNPWSPAAIIEAMESPRGQVPSPATDPSPPSGD
jgi:hypothetical protein